MKTMITLFIALIMTGCAAFPDDMMERQKQEKKDLAQFHIAEQKLFLAEQAEKEAEAIHIATEERLENQQDAFDQSESDLLFGEHDNVTLDDISK